LGESINFENGTVVTPSWLNEVNTLKETTIPAHLADIVTVPAASKIPRALTSGKLDIGWVATTADITYYVDATLGNDANDGLAAGAGHALQTIQAAINKIPQVVNHTVTINVAAGTYAETVTIAGFTGKGTLIINGGNSLATAVNYLVNKIFCNCNAINMQISGFKANADGTNGEFQISSSVTVMLNYCITLRATVNGFYCAYSNVYLNNCQSSNHTFGVMGFDGTVSCYDCIGSGNTWGVYSRAGCLITLGGANTSGLGKRIKGTSGNYAVGNGGIIGPYETGNTTTLYVRTDGSDDNDGSANDAAHALLTINEAVRRIPPKVNHTVTVVVGAGTYAEQVIVAGFVGAGSITIQGTDSTIANYSVSNIFVTGNICQVVIKWFTITSTTENPVRILLNPGFVYISTCSCTSSAPGIYGFYIAESGVAEIGNCIISNHSSGITADLTTLVHSYQNSGTGNTTGLFATNGSTLTKYGTQPAGTTAESATNGGVIR